MNTRKLELGNRNLIGKRIAAIRKEKSMTQTELLTKLYLKDISISTPALSLLEGQKRPVFDFFLLK